MSRWKQSMVVFSLTAASVAGCYGSAYVAPDGEVVMETEPPPPPYEPVPVLAYGQVWVSGYWHADRGRWVWVGGHAERGRPGAVWVAPYHERRGRVWVYHRGHWNR